MAKTRAQKADVVAKMTDRLKRMKGAAFSQAMGYTMADADKLRAKAAEKNIDVFVAKKTLLVRAAEDAGVRGVSRDALDGSILVAVSYTDEVAAAKLLKEFSKEKQTVTLLAGVLEGAFVGGDEVKRLADLPSKEQLLGQLVGTLNAPVSGFVNVLAGNLRGLVTVIKAVQDKQA